MPSLNPVQLAFFSYAHEDAEFAQRLAKDLRAGGAAVWMDRLDIKPGQRWDRTIEDALASCPQLLVILSPAATESTNVMDEVSLALEEGKIVLPVIHRQCKIPFRLRRLQYVDLTQNYSEGLARLLETLRSATPSSEMTQDVPQQELVDPSDHNDRAKEVKLLSQPALQEQRATMPMPKKRVFSLPKSVIGMVAVLVAVAFVASVVVLSRVTMFKEAGNKQPEALTPQKSPAAAAPTAAVTATGGSTSQNPQLFSPSPETNPTAQEPAALSHEDKVSYSIGLQIGSNLVRQKVEISPDDLGAGIKDALAGKPRLTSEQVKEVLGQLQKNKDEGKPLEENEKKKASYSIGLNIGFNLKRQKVAINPDVLVGAIKDAIAGKPHLTPDEVKDVMAQFEKEKQATQKQAGEKNKTEGASFLEENKNKSGVKTTASGLQYKVLRHGTGPQPKAIDTVTVNYRGTLIDGTEFDSSYKRGQPSTFPVNGVIKGWTEALQLMNVGSKYQLFIPANLAYGERAMGPNIGPNSTLIFEVELVGIKAK